MNKSVWIIVAVLVVLAIAMISSYNNLVTMNEKSTANGVRLKTSFNGALT